MRVCAHPAAPPIQDAFGSITRCCAVQGCGGPRCACTTASLRAKFERVRAQCVWMSVCALSLLCLSVRCSCGSRRDLGVGAVQQSCSRLKSPGGLRLGLRFIMRVQQWQPATRGSRVCGPCRRYGWVAALWHTGGHLGLCAARAVFV